MLEQTKTIEISHDTTMDIEDFQDSIGRSLRTIEEMYNVTGTWLSETVYEIRGSSIHGTIKLIGSKVIVKLTLGMLLVPFASTIEGLISSALKERLK